MKMTGLPNVTLILTDAEAAQSIARVILRMLAPPVGDYQRELIFDELRRHFCFHCGSELSPEVPRCFCRRDPT